MFRLRRLLVLLIVVSIVVLTMVIYQHLQQQKPEEVLNLLPENIDLALQDLHYTQSEEGQKRWTLDASKAEYQRDSRLAKLQAVTLHFYHVETFGTFTLQADQGELAQQQRQVDIWGGVELTAKRGEQLFTERLHYDDQTRQLSTAEPFRFYSSWIELTGTGMQIDIDRGHFLVEENVWMRFSPAEKRLKE